MAAAALAALSVVLLTLPIATHKPGLPATLKADEPAYVLAALSLAFDGDLQVEERDLERLFESYPFLSVKNLIVMSSDGWRTLFYGKPYIYSLCAAPFAALFGPDGVVFFNMLLFVGLLWMGFDVVRRVADDGSAALFSVGFFGLSTAWSYVFWLHPEVFNMASAAGCLYFGLLATGDLDRWASAARARAPLSSTRTTAALAASAAILAVGVYNKPMLAAFGVPVLFALARGGRWRGLAIWLAAAIASMACLAGGSLLATGQPTAYLVDARAGFTVTDPSRRLVEPIPLEVEVVTPEAPVGAGGAALGEKSTVEDDAEDGAAVAGAGWWWLLRVPETTWTELSESLVAFATGRHTGFVLYQPFGVLALLLFLIHAPRDPLRWTILLSALVIGLFFLLFIAFNWHGGGGFVGNRYFVMAYPAFLFLVPSLRPRFLLVAGWAMGALFLGPLVWSPYGLVTVSPTLQSHVRSALHEQLPIELSLNEIPGSHGLVQSEAWLWGRKDLLRPAGDTMWLRGGVEGEAWLMSATAIESAVFEISAPRRQIMNLCLADACRSVEVAPQPRTVTLEPDAPTIRRRPRDRRNPERFYDLEVYRLRFHIPFGELPAWRADAAEIEAPRFYLGARLRYLGGPRSEAPFGERPAARAEP
ncbi:MAG: hypothetical protein AAGN46_00455 [Acidobacteriota bacterium]